MENEKENFVFLETERLILRKFREADFDDFCEYAMDAEMCRMMGREDMHDAASARPAFDWLMKKEERGYVLVYKENNKVIGNLTVCPPASCRSGRGKQADPSPFQSPGITGAGG